MGQPRTSSLVRTRNSGGKLCDPWEARSNTYCRYCVHLRFIGPSRVRREESMRRRPSVQRCAVAALLMVAASASTRGPPGPLPVAVGVRRLTVAGGGPLQMHRCMRRSGRSPASTSIRCRRMRCANDSCLSSKRPSRYPMMRAGRFLHAYMAQCHTVV